VSVRQRIKEQLKTVPRSVIEGGVMTASLWKAKAEKANKLVAQPRASDRELEMALFDLMNFK
jgi:hypothetical protein